MTSPSAPTVSRTRSLLIVEDSNEDFEALQRFLQKASTNVSVQRCVSGEEALAFLYRTGRYVTLEQSDRPGLIVLDLNLPGTDGREVLRQIKQDDRLKTIPIVVFTTSNNPKDISDCYQYGANSYIIKPINFKQLKHDIQTLVDYWFEVATLPDVSEY